MPILRLSEMSDLPAWAGPFSQNFLTMESFSRQFQLNKEEKEAVAWGWNREGGDTMFHVVNAYTTGAQFEELSAESSYRLQKVGGEILEMVQ